MKVTWKRGIGIGLALVLVIAAGVYSSDHFLKATDGEENLVEPTESGETAAFDNEVFEGQEEEAVVAIVQGVFESDLLEEPEAGENAGPDGTENAEALPEETESGAEALPGESGDETGALPEEAETGTETLTDETEAGTEAADEGAAYQEADTTADTGGQTAGENVSAVDELTTENEAIEEAAEEEPTEEATEEESTEERSVQIAYEVVGGEYTGAGSTIKLTAVVNGYKEPSYQWQYDDGSGWKDIKGATDSVYMLDVTEENISYVWRVDVE